jgi:spermidine/putrescine transport system permease protein
MSRRLSPSRLLAGAYVTAIMVFLFLPLAIMVLFSLNHSPRLSFPFDGPTLHWYRAIAGDSEFVDAFKRSLFVGVCTAIGSGLLGLSGALGLIRIGARSRALILGIALIPLGFPALLYAIGLASFFHQIGFGFSLWATIAGHIVIALPFVFLAIGASLERFRFSLVDAARDLGASPWTAFRTITLPIIMPAVLGAMLLAMAISIDEFVIATFTAGQSKTLPMLLYGRLNLGVNPSLNVVGTVLLVITMGLALVATQRGTRRGA